MLKLNVGLSKKIGLPDYGSRGASVNLELELDSSLVGEPDRLKERIRCLFGLAKASVDEELASGTSSPPTNGHEQPPSNGNGRRRDGTRAATASQVRALNTIAERRQIDLAAVLVQRFQIHDPAALTITEASALIDELKGAGNSMGDRR
jgi:hypothetical protein